MSDTSAPRDTLRVMTCDTDETLAAAGGLFNQYRSHYGQPPDRNDRTVEWLTDMVESKMLTVYTASVDSSAGAPPIGLATTEPDNQAALGLYRSLGFSPVEGLASLSLDLTPGAIEE